jgi:hypothetical protein
MGLKQGAIGNTHEEHIGNLMGTKGKMKKILLFPTLPHQKKT